MCLHLKELALTAPLEFIFIYVLFKSISITVCVCVSLACKEHGISQWFPWSARKAKKTASFENLISDAVAS